MEKKDAGSQHAFVTFSNDIKSGKLGAVILMTGEEDYLIDWAAKSICDKYVSKGGLEVDFIKYDKYSCSEDEPLIGFIDQCNLYSMFSEKKVLWLKDFSPIEGEKPNTREISQNETDHLLKYLDNPCEGTILIISTSRANEKNGLYSEIRKKATFYNFCKLDYGQVLSFAAKRFRLSGIEVPREGLKFIISETGYFNKDSDYRLYNFISDIEKIIAHSTGGRITQEDVIQTLHGDLDTYVFDFLDGISQNKKDQAYTVLHNMIDSGTDFFSLLGLLISHFEFVLDVKELKQDGIGVLQIAKELGAKDYRIKKAMPAVDKLSVSKIKSLLSQLYEIERQIKTGALEQNLALELFVARI